MFYDRTAIPFQLFCKNRSKTKFPYTRKFVYLAAHDYSIKECAGGGNVVCREGELVNAVIDVSRGARR